MANGRKLGALEVVYASVVGGLISLFVLLAIYMVFIEKNLAGLIAGPPISAVFTGLFAVVALLAAGLYLSERIGWLGSALLFASGFTALWSVAVGAIQHRSLTLFALGGAITVGGVMGWWRFGGGNVAATPAQPPYGIPAYPAPPVRPPAVPAPVETSPPAAPMPVEPQPAVRPPAAAPDPAGERTADAPEGGSHE